MALIAQKYLKDDVKRTIDSMLAADADSLTVLLAIVACSLLFAVCVTLASPPSEETLEFLVRFV